MRLLENISAIILAGGKVVVRASARKQAAVVTAGCEAAASECDVTEGRSWPDVVHRPDNGLARAQDLPDRVE